MAGRGACAAARARAAHRRARTGDDPEMRLRLTTFQQALQGLGWTDGRNVHIETRFAAGNAAVLRKYGWN